MFDKYPWLGWVAVGAVELAALLLGMLLCHFGLIVWFLVPLFLLVPPVVVVVWLVGGLIRAEARGENPFQ